MSKISKVILLVVALCAFFSGSSRQLMALASMGEVQASAGDGCDSEGSSGATGTG